ncbi:MAG: glutamine-hydrolyzing carbamoyl-phosphate synthase small subunit [Candidatus Omnitrophica bacterium]|nr:glutamine-hydrolyzing carbamoyl-phosphate synthase small subunit [Candidatus Omnitrophota bacterium]
MSNTSRNAIKPAKLVLEDGRVFSGTSFGADGTCTGEVVFNTSMAGYQEILTDPSYKGQIVTMTYPLIGNYGVNSHDVESCRPWVEGFVVKECSKIVSNWRASQSLPEYLREHGILGIEGIDTRALTMHIRIQGAMKAVISTEELDPVRLRELAVRAPGVLNQDLVKEVTCREPVEWNTKGKYHVVVLDCGVKWNILRLLQANECRVTRVPAATPFEEILALDPDGVLLSNGPGDPSAVPYVVETVKKLIGRVPLFGICLGHQMLGLALGGRSYKLKFGHHGGNQPVKDTRSQRVAITVQNHGFCVEHASLDEKEIEVTHMNLNDQTLEGIKHRRYPVFSVQFHPESGPGPHDARGLFAEFIRMCDRAA